VQLTAQLLAAHATVDQRTTASLIAQAINAEIARMNIVIGLWLFLTMVIAAYVFASITLWPIKNAMEKQRRFIGNVSHELKTPISVIKANSEVTLMDVDQLRDEELAAALKSNLEEIDQMSKIVQFLLNFSTLENRLKTLEMTSVDLKAVVEKALKSAERLAAEKDIEVVFAAEDKAFIWGNAIALEEMILNLIKNAIAHTPPQGLVALQLWRNRSNALFSVQDTGIGIHTGDLPNIFEPFYNRGTNALDNKKDTNVGLGLVIVKDIATAHHATISTDSKRGRGTTFTIRFSALS